MLKSMFFFALIFQGQTFFGERLDFEGVIFEVAGFCPAVSDKSKLEQFVFNIEEQPASSAMASPFYKL